MVRQNYDMTCFCKSWEGEFNDQAIDEQVAAGGRNVQLQIDGGVKAHNIAMLREWGVTNAVVGSGLFNANASVADNLTTLHQALND